MTDIVERLRQTVQQGLPDRNILAEAAAEIERLEAELELIRADRDVLRILLKVDAKP